MPVPPGTDPADARMLAVQQSTLQISGFEAQQLPLRRVIFLRNLPIQLEEAAPVLGVPIQAGRDGLTTVHAVNRDDTTARQRETFAGRIWQRGPNFRACPDSHPISTTDRELGILVITHMRAIGSAAAKAPSIGSGTEGLDGSRVSWIEHAPESKQASRHPDSSMHICQISGFHLRGDLD